MNPKHPVYIISKGRWQDSARLTSTSLEFINVPYRIVVEPQEYDNYAAVIDPAKILTLPFSNLGQGSIPARNWVWEHSISEGAEWHWIMDDNIRWFYRANYNMKVPVADGAIFRAAEDFAERYENVPQAGLQYYMFYPRREKRPPFFLNTRIYSCILLRNDLYPEFAWRGRYNEDTDLSLRILKAGYCTILYNAFLANKIATLLMGGGNTDELYADDGRLKMAQSLVDQHPDVVRIQKRWGRYQHLVDYRPFKGNLLRRKDGLVLPEDPEYGMRFQEKFGDEWRDQDPREPMKQYFPTADELPRTGKPTAAQRAAARPVARPFEAPERAMLNVAEPATGPLPWEQG